ncbi:hypothetical protein [Myceligenerans xiligouense]|uniref:hypothetical protein n=1 Tax=Myceligenerans xiligouense TaxID=253184 RepID=UPI000F4E0F68|nr:hypothetical protein [Myceligenerans xiligouense]
MASDNVESKFDITEIYVDEIRDVGDLGEPVGAMIEYLIENPGSRFGVVQDGFVAAVVIDRVDASIFEHLQVRYQQKPGEHQAREPRVSAGTIKNETGSGEDS